MCCLIDREKERSTGKDSHLPSEKGCSQPNVLFNQFQSNQSQILVDERGNMEWKYGIEQGAER